MFRMAFLTAHLATLLAAGPLLTATPVAVQAGQEEQSQANVDTWFIGVRLGVGSAQLRDEVLGPLAYSGYRLRLGADLAITHGDAGQHQHELALSIAPAYISDRFDYWGILLTHEAHYRYLHALPTANTSRFWVGGGAGTRLNPALYAAAATDYLFWSTVYDLRISGRWEQAFSKGRSLTVGLTLPLGGLASRPPRHRFDVGETTFWSVYGDTQHAFEPVTWNRYAAAETTACYRYMGGPGGWELCYRFLFERLSAPEPVLTVDHMLEHIFWF